MDSKSLNLDKNAYFCKIKCNKETELCVHIKI